MRTQRVDPLRDQKSEHYWRNWAKPIPHPDVCEWVLGGAYSRGWDEHAEITDETIRMKDAEIAYLKGMIHGKDMIINELKNGENK